MNQQTDLEKYEVAIKEVFTIERLPAILAVFNSFRPRYGNFIKSNEFETIVHAAKTDAMDVIQMQITEFVFNNNEIKYGKN